MPRFRIGYNAQALFAGPSPASGYYFLSTVDKSINNSFLSSNINLISYINRVQNVSFQIEAPKTKIQQVGFAGNIRDYTSEPPTVNVSFEYIQNGVRNEDKLGLYVNFPSQESSIYGQPIFPNNTGVFLLSGFYTSSMGRSSRAYGYPLDYRDSRNLFLTINKNEGRDFNSISSGVNTEDCNVIGFGNCYLTSYRAKASVGDFPRVSVNYIGDNVRFYTSGSGFFSPALNVTDYTPFEDTKCIIPNNFEDELVTALLPGDITMNITAYPQTTGINVLYGTGYIGNTKDNVYQFGVNHTGIQIQNYDLTIDLQRKPVKNLIYKLPLNRKLIFPCEARLNFQAIVHDYISGSLETIFNNEEEYDVSISIRNPTFALTGGVAVKYDVLKAKLENISYDTSIGANKTINVSLVTQMSPHDLSRGLFISGLYNTRQNISSSSRLLKENGEYILLEDSSFILLEDNTYLL